MTQIVLAQGLAQAGFNALFGKDGGINIVADGGDGFGDLQNVDGALRFLQGWRFGGDGCRGIIAVFAAETERIIDAHENEEFQTESAQHGAQNDLAGKAELAENVDQTEDHGDGGQVALDDLAQHVFAPGNLFQMVFSAKKTAHDPDAHKGEKCSPPNEIRQHASGAGAQFCHHEEGKKDDENVEEDEEEDAEVFIFHVCTQIAPITLIFLF